MTSGCQIILAEHVLHRLPVLRHVLAAVPGTSLVALHLCRLAAVTAPMGRY